MPCRGKGEDSEVGFLGAEEKEWGRGGKKRGQWAGHNAHLGVALKGAHLVFNHRAILLAITEPLF